MPNSNRFERIGEEYKKEISNIINYKLKNPNVTGLISVTKVKVTNDLKYQMLEQLQEVLYLQVKWKEMQE